MVKVLYALAVERKYFGYCNQAHCYRPSANQNQLLSEGNKQTNKNISSLIPVALRD